jgi:hypothetical protein
MKFEVLTGIDIETTVFWNVTPFGCCMSSLWFTEDASIITDSLHLQWIFRVFTGIQQYLFENGRIDNIFTDSYYDVFTECLDEVAKKFTTLYNDSRKYGGKKMFILSHSFTVEL